MFEKIQKMISSQLNIELEKITPETNINEDFKVDSLDMLELFMEFEETFNVELTDEEIKSLTCVSDIVKILESK